MMDATERAIRINFPGLKNQRIRALIREMIKNPVMNSRDALLLTKLISMNVSGKAGLDAIMSTLSVDRCIDDQEDWDSDY